MGISCIEPYMPKKTHSYNIKEARTYLDRRRVLEADGVVRQRADAARGRVEPVGEAPRLPAEHAVADLVCLRFMLGWVSGGPFLSTREKGGRFDSSRVTKCRRQTHLEVRHVLAHGGDDAGGLEPGGLAVEGALVALGRQPGVWDYFEVLLVLVFELWIKLGRSRQGEAGGVSITNGVASVANMLPRTARGRS